MSTHPASDAWEGSVDLRKWAVSLLNNWKIISASVVLSTTIAVVFSFLVQPTVYESSGGIFLPTDTLRNEFGFTQQGYLEFSSSTEVLELVRGQLDIEQAPGQLRNQFTFTLEHNDFLAVSATANSADGAFLLADAWINSYQQAIASQIDAEFNESKIEAAQRVDFLWPQVTLAEEALERFNLEFSRLEARSSYLDTQLTVRENRLNDLSVLESPHSEYSLALLQTPLGSESGAIGGGGTSGEASPIVAFQNALAPETGEAFRPSIGYVQLSRNLTIAQFLSLEKDLVTSENRLRQLKFTSVPLSEIRVASLEKALLVEPAFLVQSQSDSPISGDPIQNPIYLDLSKDLANSRVQLDVEKSEVESLTYKITDLKIQLEQTRRDLLDSFEDSQESGALEVEIVALTAQALEVGEEVIAQRSIRRELENEARPLRTRYNVAKAEEDRLAGLEVSREWLPQLTTIREPAIPNSPISPQRSRNIALSIFLGLVTGVTASLLLDFYRGRNRPIPTHGS